MKYSGNRLKFSPVAIGNSEWQFCMSNLKVSWLKIAVQHNVVTLHSGLLSCVLIFNIFVVDSVVTNISTHGN